MEPKVGQTIYAINECRLINDNRQTLTINQPYVIDWISGRELSIIDDENSPHSFDLSESSVDYWGKYFTTEPPKKERYFIVFYYGDANRGTSDVIDKNGEYPKRNHTQDYLREQLKDKSIAITNIIELNQQDYESWNK